MKEEAAAGVLELLLAEPEEDTAGVGGTSGVIVGTLSGFDEGGRPLITWAGDASSGSVPARSTVALCPDQVAGQVVIVFEDGDPRKPIVVGALWRGGAAPQTGIVLPHPRGVEADVDGETLVLTAKREIVLRCGKSSITLTRAGKVLIRGTYLLSRSSGVNRIKGGSVQIN